MKAEREWYGRKDNQQNTTVFILCAGDPGNVVVMGLSVLSCDNAPLITFAENFGAERVVKLCI